MSEADASRGLPQPAAGGSRRVAVVAIHGVGDHPPFATAREIGDLLSNLEYKPSNTPRYAPFTEVIKRINVRPTKVLKSGGAFNWTDPSLQRQTWGPLDALAGAVFRGETSARCSRQSDNKPDSLDHLFMQGQLVEYKGEKPEDTYQCLRLEGRRVAPVGPKAGAPPRAPAPDMAGRIASDLRHSGVELRPGPAGESAAAATPDPAADPASPGTQEKIVHLYEMYWSDLSQLGNSFTRIFGELYQLMFQLGSVSVNNVRAAAIHFHGEFHGEGSDGRKTATAKRWQAFAQAQGFAAAVLAWPVPILNLFMTAVVPVILLVSLMRSYLSARGEFIALDTLVGALLVIASGIGLTRLRSVSPKIYPLPLILFGGGSVAVALAMKPFNRDLTESLAAAALFLPALAGVWLVVEAYDARRPGSKRAAAWIAAMVVSATLVARLLAGRFPLGGSDGYPAIETCLNILEVTFLFTVVSWAVFYAAFVWAHVAGWRAVRAVRPGDADYRNARHSRWTAQLVLALSALIFISLTISVWTGIVKAGISALPGQENVLHPDVCAVTARPVRSDEPCRSGPCAPVRYEPVSPKIYSFLWAHRPHFIDSTIAARIYARAQRFTACTPLVSEFANQMFQAAGIGFLPVILLAFLVAFLITLWALFPSAWTELYPPGSDSAQDLGRESSALGSWLDRGFRFMRWAGEILYWTMWLPPGLLLLLNVALLRGYVTTDMIDGFIAIVGAVVGGTAVGIVGFSGRLKNLAGGLRPLVRVMLDVDNWLREHPRESNPTARICGRYVSLLRHISGWRDSDPANSPYDAVVIVAHSQGTVITADFLRFLQAEAEQAGSVENYDPELADFAGMHKLFFTMGCPLHQLYGLRFPYLYGWARNTIPDDAPPPGVVPDIDGDESPRPDRLGVHRWINAYRSGDYIGRCLWRGGTAASYRWDPAMTDADQEWDPPAGKPENVSADQAGRRIEFSIGPGAHTHYWDHTGGLIAEVLDRMINSA